MHYIFFKMSVIPMCFSNAYKYKISVETHQFLLNMYTTPGLHVSTPLSHHQALHGGPDNDSSVSKHVAQR
jgi:hypothetical protein